MPFALRYGFFFLALLGDLIFLAMVVWSWIELPSSYRLLIMGGVVVWWRTGGVGDWSPKRIRAYFRATRPDKKPHTPSSGGSTA